ncbi:MAG TPA: hypothetical protein PLX39_15500 [Pyrinomonadaceae bacterium]|nr:hypothetical protein [Pyrinomonadaceae bacterium]
MPHVIILDKQTEVIDCLNDCQPDLELIHDAIHAIPKGTQERRDAENALNEVGNVLDEAKANYLAAIAAAKSAAGLA